MIRFGTGGWRAVIGKDFTCDNVRSVAGGLCKLIREDPAPHQPVVIGYDRRFLSLEASKWVAEVLAANGIPVLCLKRSAPTPLIMYLVKTMGLSWGIQVTASHNPAIYNGIKLIVREGRDAPIEITDKLEAAIQDDPGIFHIPFEEAAANGLVRFLRNPFNGFIDDIIRIIDMEKIREAGPRILFDSMHGSGSYPLMTVLYTARCTMDWINGNRDAYFGGVMPAPSFHSLSELLRRVPAEGYDLGIAMDGDGDRLGIIDGNGSFVSANEILVLLYYYLHEHKGWRGPVVRNVLTTHLLDRMAHDFGEECFEVPVGFKYISSMLDETNAVLGGESSGGLTVRGYIHGKDSIYAASLFVEMISALNKTPAELLGELYLKYGKSCWMEESHTVSPDQIVILIDELANMSMLPEIKMKIKSVSHIDGCKILFEDGSFAAARLSGTEPLLRIVAEAGSKEQVDSYLDAVRKQLVLSCQIVSQ